MHARTEIITVDDLKNLMGELRGMARVLLLTESRPHSLTPTALALSALRRAKGSSLEWDDVRWENRRHFFGAIRMTMGHALIDHARRARAKGRDKLVFMRWDEEVLRNLPEQADERPDLIIALEEALAILKVASPRLSEVIEQFYFAGFTVDEMARFSEVSGRAISEKSVDRELKRARILLRKSLEKLLGSR